MLPSMHIVLRCWSVPTNSQSGRCDRFGGRGHVTGPHLHFEVYYNGVRQESGRVYQLFLNEYLGKELQNAFSQNYGSRGPPLV